jgi:superfamily II DNA/RNA helicase
LGVLPWLVDRVDDLGYPIPTPIQAEACETILQSSAASCSLVAPTGSGKTLAFLLSCLSLLSYPPDTYPEDLEGPQLVVVVPTRELGVQIAMIVFKLFGGSVASDGIPGNRANMYKFTGPRGLRVKGLILEDEVEQAVEHQYLFGAHVVVGTPDLIFEAISRGVTVVGKDCRAIVVDEADACFKLYEDAMQGIMEATKEIREHMPKIVMAGATLSQSAIELAEKNQWIVPESFVHVDINSDSSGTSSLISSRLRHRYVTANDSDMLGMLCRTILADQKAHSLDSHPTRGIVYVKDSSVARKIVEPLRSILWSKHDISVLLPDGQEPIKNLHAFRDNKTTLLIATLASSRGLDLPAVTHVYLTGVLPPADEYVHMCGRLGRIGSSDAGVMTTFIDDGTETEFRSMLTTLGVCDDNIERLEPPMPRTLEDFGVLEDDSDALDDAKRALETILALSKHNDDDDDGNDTDAFTG